MTSERPERLNRREDYDGAPATPAGPAPTSMTGLFEPAVALHALARHKVRHVIIGGIAAQLHGSRHLAHGLDLTPDRDPANLARLAGALVDLQARPWVPGLDYPQQTAGWAGHVTSAPVRS